MNNNIARLVFLIGEYCIEIFSRTDNGFIAGSSQHSTRFDANTSDKDSRAPCSKKEFCLKLTELILKNQLFTNFITETIVDCYSNDLVRIYCMVVEEKFDNDHTQSTDAINFISSWLLLKDDHNVTLPKAPSSELVFRLAEVYTTFEYEQDYISSIYSACRIINGLNKNGPYCNELCKDKESTRSKVRDELFRVLFDLLWTRLCELCSGEDQKLIHQWTYMYTLVHKYYPPDAVLRSARLDKIRDQIEFMRLSYSILFDESIVDSAQLVAQLLDHQPRDQTTSGINNNESTYLEKLPVIFNTINQYIDHRNETEHSGGCTLMIDFQKWISTILRTSTQRSEDDIKNVFNCLDDSKCKFSMPIKQLLFDELADLIIPKSSIDLTPLMDRIEYLLPTVIQCTSEKSLLQNYQIPYHPCVLEQHQDKRPILLDLFFFHIDHHFHENAINLEQIEEWMVLKAPRTKNPEIDSYIQVICKQLKDYFLVCSTALYLCETKLADANFEAFSERLRSVINTYLLIDPSTLQLSAHLNLFLSKIISRRSWKFLVDLLKSDPIQMLNSTWSNILYSHLELKLAQKSSKSLQASHQLQFALSSDHHALSIFPDLHQSYFEMNEIIFACLSKDTETQWNPLCDWIQLRLNTDSAASERTNIKVMLLLNIYYNYYCNNELQVLNRLFEVIERMLEPMAEEILVFRSLLEPEKYMNGYCRENTDIDFNHLNDSFRLDCDAPDELCIRHLLVNLMAMIIKGGTESFLWTFAFQPTSIEHTYG